jgi:hypothetical protein
MTEDRRRVSGKSEPGAVKAGTGSAAVIAFGAAIPGTPCGVLRICRSPSGIGVQGLSMR